MATFQTLLLIGHTVIALLIIGLVMIQRGKGADAGAGFGSGASGTVFGAKGSANFLSRSTAALATAFFASSMTLAYLGGQHEPAAGLLESVLDADSEQVLMAPTPGDQVDLDGLPGLDTSMPDAGKSQSDVDGLPALDVPASPEGTGSEGTNQ